ncbi:MAG: hypothetical protein IJ395_03655 [Clostridia bacterium]|nr:hypothetical protein [Clostridia bacterium]
MSRIIIGKINERSLSAELCRICFGESPQLCGRISRRMLSFIGYLLP